MNDLSYDIMRELNHIGMCSHRMFHDYKCLKLASAFSPQRRIWREHLFRQCGELRPWNGHMGRGHEYDVRAEWGRCCCHHGAVPKRLSERLSERLPERLSEILVPPFIFSCSFPSVYFCSFPFQPGSLQLITILVLQELRPSWISRSLGICGDRTKPWCWEWDEREIFVSGFTGRPQASGLVWLSLCLLFVLLTSLVRLNQTWLKAEPFSWSRRCWSAPWTTDVNILKCHYCISTHFSIWFWAYRPIMSVIMIERGSEQLWADFEKSQTYTIFHLSRLDRSKHVSCLMFPSLVLHQATDLHECNKEIRKSI